MCLTWDPLGSVIIACHWLILMVTILLSWSQKNVLSEYCVVQETLIHPDPAHYTKLNVFSRCLSGNMSALWLIWEQTIFPVQWFHIQHNITKMLMHYVKLTMLTMNKFRMHTDYIYNKHCKEKNVRKIWLMKLKPNPIKEPLLRAVPPCALLLLNCWGKAGGGIVSTRMGPSPGKTKLLL